MDNSQSTQQQSSLSYSRLARSSRREIAQLAGWNSLLALIKHRPRLVLGGVWGFLIAIAAIAAFNLTNTGRVEQQEQPPTSIAATPVLRLAQPSLAKFRAPFGRAALTEETTSRPSRSAAWLDNPAKTSSQTRSPMRLWLLGAVALTCAGGSLVIYKRLNRSSQPRQRQLPPQESPLDSGSESLAEMMDIRKQRSVSSILRDL